MDSKITCVEDFSEALISASSNLNNKNVNTRKRTQNRVWIKIREFSNSEDAEKHIESEKMWKKSSSKKNLDGKKVEFRCTKGKYRDNECPAGLYLLYHSLDNNVSLYSTDCDHDNHTESERGLNEKTKLLITNLFEDGIRKPNSILHAIRKRNEAEPPKSKVISFLRQLRNKKYGCPTISGTEIKKWCDERRVPETQDSPFVLDYKLKCESFDVDEQEIKIFISTPRLLNMLKYSKLVQIDATYKIIWQGYPLMVIGTSDKDRVFHPFGISICDGEITDDFGFIFTTLQKYDANWNPELLLADGSDAISNGFKKVFGEPKLRLMCFFHALKNMEKYLRASKSYSTLKDDIWALQTCTNENNFSKASNLFMEKWSIHEDESVQKFLKYFESEWLGKYRNWYEGAAIGYPSTNNGIEATNAIIKKEHTLRERLLVGQFLNHVFDLLVKWSVIRDPQSPNFKSFVEKVSVLHKDWVAAYQWAASNKKKLKTDGDGCNFYYTAATKSRFSRITQDIVNNCIQKEGSWESFDEFTTYRNGIHVITIDTEDHEKSTCNCVYFLKKMLCKHVLGMKIRLHLIDVPPEAKNIPLGQKRKRGRPAHAKKALIVQ